MQPAAYYFCWATLRYFPFHFLSVYHQQDRCAYSHSSRIVRRLGRQGLQQPRTWLQRAVVVRSVAWRGNIAEACPSAFFRLYLFHNQQKQQLLLRRSRSFDRAHITNSTHNYSATLHPEKWLRRQARFSFSQFQRHQQFASRPLPGRPASGKGSTTLRYHRVAGASSGSCMLQ